MRKTPQTIPRHIRPHLSEDIIKILEEDGHGISYPDRWGIQTRARRFCECIDSGYFALSAYPTVQDAVLAAMARTTMIRLKHPVIRSKTGNVRIANRYDYRKGMMEYRVHADFTQEDGRRGTKTFSFGYSIPSQSKLLHGLRTAHLFRQMFEEYGHDMDFLMFKKWKTRRLYDGHKHFAW